MTTQPVHKTCIRAPLTIVVQWGSLAMTTVQEKAICALQLRKCNFHHTSCCVGYVNRSWIGWHRPISRSPQDPYLTLLNDIYGSNVKKSVCSAEIQHLDKMNERIIPAFTSLALNVLDLVSTKVKNHFKAL